MPPPRGQSVTHVSGIKCHPCLRKHTVQLQWIVLPQHKPPGNWTTVDYKPCAGDAVASRKPLSPTPVAVHELRKGGGLQDLRLKRSRVARKLPTRPYARLADRSGSDRKSVV